MKKIITTVLLCAMLTIGLVGSLAAPGYVQISVTLDGEPIVFDVPPQMIDNRTMVPFRAIFEALGAQVQWDDELRMVRADRGSIAMTMQIGSRRLNVNGVITELDVPAQIINNRTLVPARAVAESFGVDVQWDESTRTVVLTTGDASQSTSRHANHPVSGDWETRVGGNEWNFWADGNGGRYTAPGVRAGFSWEPVEPGLIRVTRTMRGIIEYYYYEVSENTMTLTESSRGSLATGSPRTIEFIAAGSREPVRQPMYGHPLVGLWTNYFWDRNDNTGIVFRDNGTGYEFGPGYRIEFTWQTQGENLVTLNESAWESDMLRSYYFYITQTEYTTGRTYDHDILTLRFANDRHTIYNEFGRR